MTESTVRIADPADSRPYYRLLGFKTDPCPAPGCSRVTVAGRPDLENSHGDIHGGVVASLLDAAMGVALRSVLPEGAGATTVSLTVNYLQPGRTAVTAHGRVVRSGRTLASLEATVEDASGSIVAHGLGTMRIINRSRDRAVSPEV
jgi:uncharacterized protein (TIGR00369 family)